MSKKETIIGFVKALENGSKNLDQYVTDDFLLHIDFPTPFDKHHLINFVSLSRRSVPDMSIKVLDVNEDDDKINVLLKAKGSYQVDFQGLPNGIANGQKIDLPSTNFEFIFSGNKIKEVKIPNISREQIQSIIDNKK